MAVSKRLRFEVMKRDGHTCRYCGTSAADGAKLTIDHVRPSALGGGDEPSNLVTACVDCNAGKSSTSPDEQVVEDVALDALRWSKAVKAASTDRKRYRRKVVTAQKAVAAIWPHNSLPTDWTASVERFVTAGLDKDDLEFFMTKAIGGGRSYDHAWRYFCKVCWVEITALQKAAADALAEPEPPKVEKVEAPAEEPEEEPWVEPTHRPGWEDLTSFRWCIECDENPSGWDNGMCDKCNDYFGVA